MNIRFDMYPPNVVYYNADFLINKQIKTIVGTVTPQQQAALKYLNRSVSDNFTE